MTGASWSDGSEADDAWGPATSVRSSSSEPAPTRAGRVPPRPERASRPARGEVGTSPPPGRDPWQSGWDAPPQAANGWDKPPQAANGWDAPPARARASARAKLEHIAAARPDQQRGVRAFLAVLTLVALTILGILVDALRGQQLGTGFNLGVIIGSVVAALMVRRSGLFPVVVAPPIVYSLGAGVSLYVRSSGLSDRSALIDAATNWLVYGFPAIAAATAAVLIIAGLRLITRR